MILTGLRQAACHGRRGVLTKTPLHPRIHRTRAFSRESSFENYGGDGERVEQRASSTSKTRCHRRSHLLTLTEPGNAAPISKRKSLAGSRQQITLRLRQRSSNTQVWVETTRAERAARRKQSE